MKLKNSFVSMILVVSSAILPSVTTSPVPGHHLSFIQEAVSAFTAKAEKEFGSVPNSLGEGKAIGLVNIQVGPKSRGTKVFWKGEEIISREKEIL